MLIDNSDGLFDGQPELDERTLRKCNRLRQPKAQALEAKLTGLNQKLIDMQRA